MTICLRIPFVDPSPFVAFHFQEWGVRYSSQRAVARVYKIGIGCGLVDRWRVCSGIYRWNPDGDAIMTYPDGHWRWWYHDRMKR